MDTSTPTQPADLPAEPIPDAAPDPIPDEVLERGFAGDPRRLRGFVAALRRAIPREAAIILRGSAVAGSAYVSGAPFDAQGPGTSDLDVVILGDSVMDLWVPEARLPGEVNTLPLSDDEPWVAPGLDPARRRAQAIVSRPVSVQAMAGWFLDLRALLQGQPYVVLHDGR